MCIRDRAYSAGLSGRDNGFDALLGTKPKDGSSFFLPKSRYAAEGGRVADPLAGVGSARAGEPQYTIPSRYGREGTGIASTKVSATPSVFNQAIPTTLTEPTQPSLRDGLTPRIITSSEFGKTDLPLDLSQYLNVYEKNK